MGRLHYLSSEPLAPRTSLELGGSAESLVEVTSVPELTEALEWAKDSGRTIWVLGGGSNVVIADEGVAGLVLVPGLRGIDIDRSGNGAVVVAGAGETWDELVALTVSEGLLGLECLSGIPGTVGATPIQNVGAYGVEVSDVLEWVEIIDRKAGFVSRLSPMQCSFGYRTSFFRQNPDRSIVTRVAFRLRTTGRPVIRYPEVEKAVGGGGIPPDAMTVRDVVMDLRRGKGMVLESGVPRSVGSFFVNPIVDAQGLAAVEAAAGDGSVVPRYSVGDGVFKIPAAWLIENSGFARGHRQGAVGISEHHALALVHHGGGRTKDLLDLAASIQDGVDRRFGLRLRPEPVFWGFTDSDPLDGAVS
ncbi:MAG: UDP-N-acetylenolpyruvoylglucosamine reductase [Acidobacteria bacterium]|nr:MAG: UDP-N-acetylenolpyruvoylglucosamine reductase [Acidobacteriota bacterium]